jgi:MFS family permease
VYGGSTLGRFARAFGLAEANDNTVRIARSYTVLRVLDTLSLMMSIPFLFIHMADLLGGGQGQYLEAMALLGVLIVVNMATQTILDYPTGGIGDWIGQRYLLTGAFVLYSVMFLLLSFAQVGTPFWSFVMINILIGIGGALESGALGAWLDNNYVAAAPEDDERKQYGVFRGKALSLFLIVDAIVMVPGGLFAALFGRSWVFQLQAVLAIGLAIATMVLIRDLPEVEERRAERPNLREYGTLLKEGLTFTFGNPFAKYVIIGLMLVSSTFPVWWAFILTPMLYEYLRVDFAVASVVALLSIPGIFYAERSGIWAKRFEPKKWIPRFKFIQSPLFLLLMAVIMIALPPVLTSPDLFTLYLPLTDILILAVPFESLLPVLLIIIIYAIVSAFGQVQGILVQRVFVDAIPSRVRNSVYSLMPTLMLIFSMPQITFFGWIIQEYGVPLALILCSVIALIGVALLHKGLTYPIPTPAEEQAD